MYYLRARLQLRNVVQNPHKIHMEPLLGMCANIIARSRARSPLLARHCGHPFDYRA